MDRNGSAALLRCEVSTREPLDDLGTVSSTVDRLRRFVTDLSTPAEEAEALRRLDDMPRPAHET